MTDELTAEVLPAPSGPLLDLPPEWPERTRQDLTALMERHHARPFVIGDRVIVNHQLMVVDAVGLAGQPGLHLVPVRRG